MQLPNEWQTIEIEPIETTAQGGSKISFPAYRISVAATYPKRNDGTLIAGLTHDEAASLLNEQNASHGRLRMLKVIEDHVIRKKDPHFFSEDWNRPRKSGFLADMLKPTAYNSVNGVGGQLLVPKLLYWRLPHGEQEVGVVFVPSDGIVPHLTRSCLEEMIGAEGLNKLAPLRGREIYEKADEIVDVCDALGYPKFTIPHEAEVIPHLTHITRDYELTPDGKRQHPDISKGTVAMRMAPSKNPVSEFTSLDCSLVRLTTEPNYKSERTSLTLVSEL